MRKMFCDGCGAEMNGCDTSLSTPLQLPYKTVCDHHPEYKQPEKATKLLDFPGRSITFDLCTPCLESVAVAAIEKIKGLNRDATRIKVIR